MNTVSHLIGFIPIIHSTNICQVPTLCQALLMVLRYTGQSTPCPMELKSSSGMRAKGRVDDYLKELPANNYGQQH